MSESGPGEADGQVAVEVDMDRELLMALADELRHKNDSISECLSECGQRRLERADER